MRTSIAAIVSALVLATTGTAMASSSYQAPALGSGASAAMAQTYAHISHPLATAYTSQQAQGADLPAVYNGQSVAMAETFATIDQPLDRSMPSYSAQAKAQHDTALSGRSGQSAAIAKAFARIEQPLNLGADTANGYVQADSLSGANQAL